MVEATEITWESLAKGRGGDHDTQYTWGNPLMLMPPWVHAHLVVMRGHVKDHEGAIEGDSETVVQRPSGIYVPTPAPPGLEKYWHEDVEQP